MHVIFLHNPCGDTPQGKLLTQMQGMIAEYERTQILERTRRGRLEKARRGEYVPWAYHCYGYRYLPRRHDSPPHVVVEPGEAEVVRSMYRLLVAEHLRCRQMTKRLNEAHIATPSGQNQVWQPATVRNILTTCVYAGHARYNYRQPALPTYRKKDEAALRSLKTGRRYRPASEWVWSEAPALIRSEVYAKAQVQLQRKAEVAQRTYQPSSRRYVLRRLVKCGDCGLGMRGSRRLRRGQQAEYLYDDCKGHSPLTCGRVERCPSRSGRAERLATVVWQALCQLLQHPEMIPRLHQTWAEAQEHNLSTLAAQQDHLRQRQQRLERQSQRLLDAYQAEVISLQELQSRRRTLRAEVAQSEQERQQVARTQQQTIHWGQVINHAEMFRQLLGTNLELLSFEERQAVVQCLISKVVVTGVQVDIYYVLPFVSAPQLGSGPTSMPEGTSGLCCRLRLAERPLSASRPACRAVWGGSGRRNSPNT